MMPPNSPDHLSSILFPQDIDNRHKKAAEKINGNGTADKVLGLDI
jgi:hypothetical protein